MAVCRMIMLGAPGSGKGTLTARLLAAHSGRLTALASGDLLRSEMAANSEIGQRAKQAIADGRLLDDDSMISIIVAEMQRRNWVNSQQSWLLDGFPRTLEQARRLDSVLTASGPINLVVQLMVPEEAIVKRLCDRWIHEASGRVYNTSYNPPKHPGRDDVTGERLVRRADDEPVYKRETEPLADYYRARNVLVPVSGDTSDIIWPQLDEAVTRKLSTVQMVT